MSNHRTTPKLTFGVNPFDRVPDQIGRYHVIDQQGFIVSKHTYGYSAYDHAGSLSDQHQNVTFTAVDTSDGSVYGAYRNGVDTEETPSVQS